MDPMEYPDINMAFDEYKLFQPLTDTSIDENQLNKREKFIFDKLLSVILNPWKCQKN